MNTSVGDRIISAFSYLTFGTFAIIWIIYANIRKIHMNDFLSFNLYQAIFISIMLAVISLIYNIAINLMQVVPLIGVLAKKFDIFFNQTPIYFTCTLSGLFMSLLCLYLCLFSLLGKKVYVPMISEVIKTGFGR